MLFIDKGELVDWSDYDGVMQPATIRDMLPSEAQNSVNLISTHAKANIIISNADIRGILGTFNHSVGEHANLSFIGEHGSVALFGSSKQFELNPNLSIDVSVIPDLSRRAKEILNDSGMLYTKNGHDLYSGIDIVKVEEKMTSFALVRGLGGYPDHVTTKRAINQMNAVITETMNILDHEFGLSSSGWALHKGLDAQEFAQDGMCKKAGVTWALDRLELDGKAHLMHEDSNASFLEWMKRTHNAFNLAVGDNLPKPEHSDFIDAQVNSIKEYWKVKADIANGLATNHGIHTDDIRKSALTLMR